MGAKMGRKFLIVAAVVVAMTVGASGRDGRTKANTSLCTSLHAWRGKAACLVYSQHTCRSSVEICRAHNMRLFTIDDDFDVMLIFYFVRKQFRFDRGAFWVHIYDYERCALLVSDDEKFSVRFDDFEDDDRHYFFCEFLREGKVELMK